MLETRALLAINPALLEESEPNNDSANADALGVTVNNAVVAVGTISVGDRDFYSFTAPAGARVWAYVDTGGARNIAGSSRDSILTLFTTDGTTVLESDDDAGSGNGGDQDEESGLASVIAGRTLVAAGTYFLEVKAFSGTAQINPYKLFVSLTTAAPVAESTQGNNSAAVADAIGGDTPIRSAQLSPAGDVDFYSFTASAGDQVFIAVDADPERDGTSTDVTVSLIGQNGTSQINTAPVNSGGDAEGVSFRLVTAGTYFIRIQGSTGTTTGTYHLHAQVGNASRYTPEKTGDNNSSATAQLLDLSNPVIAVGNLPAGDRDFYSFTVPANSRIWAFAETGGIRNDAASTRDSILTLITTDGVTNITIGDDGGSGTGDDDTQETAASASIAGRKLTAAGTYFLKVEDFGNNDVIDPYRLFLYVTTDTGTPESEGNNTAAVANAIGGSAGNLKDGNISAGDVDFYAVDLKAGDILYTSVNGDPEQDSAFTDVNLSLIAPDTTTRIGLAANAINNSTQFETYTFRATVAGTYFLRIAQQGASTGTYQLMATVVSPVPPNTAPELNNSGEPYYIAGVGQRLPTSLTNGVLVTDLLARGAGGNPISDPDAGALRGIAITSIDKTFGKWQFTTVANPGDSDWTDIDAAGAVSVSSALLLAADANTRIRMTSTLIPHHEGTPALGFIPMGSKLDTGIQFRAWDRTTGNAGQRGDTTTNGGTTAFSTATEVVPTFFEVRLWRSFNANASLNVYTLQAEFSALTSNPAFQDRATSAFTGFTVYLSPLISSLPTQGLLRMYYGVQFNADLTETDMGYRYLTTDAGEASGLEMLGPADKRADRQGAYFRELGVSAGTAIIGYIHSTQQPGTAALTQIYRTDIANKPTRPPGTTEGQTPTSQRPQEQGDHVYTTNTAFETTKPGTWRIESNRGFVRELTPSPVPSGTATAEPLSAAATPALVIEAVPQASSDLLPLTVFEETHVAGLVAVPVKPVTTPTLSGSVTDSEKALNSVAVDEPAEEDTDAFFADLELVFATGLGA